MHIVFLDEFGHIGPFVSRHHESYKTSPVFGLAGYILKDTKVRNFATWFHQLKCQAFADDIEASGRHPANWEKKGNTLFTKGRVYKTKRLGYTLINQIKHEGGKLFYNGIEKYRDAGESNPDGLYYTVLHHTIANLDRLFNRMGDNYIIIIDEHQARLKLLESALRTMYGKNPARRLIQAPFQAESHLYPTVQAADWIATLVGSLWAYKALPAEFADQIWAEKYFSQRLDSALANYSSVRLRGVQPQQPRLL